jgi:hypothetical protein
LDFTLICGIVVFIHVASTQDVLATGLPHGMVELSLVIIVAEVARTLEREVEILAGTNAGEIVSCAA